MILPISGKDEKKGESRRHNRQPFIATVDHIKPLVKGGTNFQDNLVLCCSTCNNRKGEGSLITFLRSIVDFGSLPVELRL